MKVLLLHPEDAFPRFRKGGPWDLVIDLGRAPAASYERWRADCPLISVYQSAREVDDLYRLKNILQAGFGGMVDRCGIDWWDVLSPEIATEFRQMILADRLAKDLEGDCQLYLSRPHPLATALHSLIGGRLITLEGTVARSTRRLRHGWSVLSRLDRQHLAQVVEDRVDTQHHIRRRFAVRSELHQPAILLPTAYINGSRMAVAYAESLPERHFLLVYTRRSSKLQTLPSNVQQIGLSGYCVESDEKELASLIELWELMKKQLLEAAPEFRLANAAGVFARIPALLRWGIALRDAWNRLMEASEITGCLCTDDSNPPTRIPLLLAKTRGLPTVAVHHGALDYAMAFKNHAVDSYLAKTTMESDFLNRVCRVPREKLILGGPAKSLATERVTGVRKASWMMFFTEPYENYAWRNEEVYRDLLPHLLSVTRALDLKLVFKLHPFESVRGHRKLLRSILKNEARGIETISGPLRDDTWPNIRLALTVQSSTALDCATRGIPIFLCAWLRDSYSGYVHQFGQFGVGRALQSAEQIGEIPRLLEAQTWECSTGAENMPIEPELLSSLLSKNRVAAVCA
jgi:hypothetical protein